MTDYKTLNFSGLPYFAQATSQFNEEMHSHKPSIKQPPIFLCRFPSTFLQTVQTNTAFSIFNPQLLLFSSTPYICARVYNETKIFIMGMTSSPVFVRHAI